MTKNFNILGVHGKIRVLGRGGGGGGGGGGGRLQKKQYIVGDCLKREGTWTVCRFKGGTSQERGGGVFEGGRG